VPTAGAAAARQSRRRGGGGVPDHTAYRTGDPQNWTMWGCCRQTAATPHTDLSRLCPAKTATAVGAATRGGFTAALGCRGLWRLQESPQCLKNAVSSFVRARGHERIHVMLVDEQTPHGELRLESIESSWARPCKIIIAWPRDPDHRESRHPSC